MWSIFHVFPSSLSPCERATTFCNTGRSGKILEEGTEPSWWWKHLCAICGISCHCYLAKTFLRHQTLSHPTHHEFKFPDCGHDQMEWTKDDLIHQVWMMLVNKRKQQGSHYHHTQCFPAKASTASQSLAQHSVQVNTIEIVRREMVGQKHLKAVVRGGCRDIKKCHKTS